MLKNIPSAFCLIVCASLAFLFGCGDNGNGPDKTAKISNPYPRNRAEDVPVKITFSWTYYDTASGPVFYDFYLGTEMVPPLHTAHLTDTFFGPGSLISDTTYFWKVVACKAGGDSIHSPVWRFRTEAPLRFPTQVGNTWKYSQTYFNFGFEPDTLPQLIGEPIKDTLSGNSTTRIISRDTIYDSIEIYLFQTDWISGNNSGEMTRVCANTDSGFYMLAYQNAGWIGPPKVSTESKIYYLFNGIAFPGQDALRHYIYSRIEMPFRKIQPDTTYEDPPIRELAYPIEVGTGWTYRDTDLGHIWDMAKEVVGTEIVSVPAGNFECFKIRWYWDMDHNGEWDSTIEGYDYLTGAGIVKREFIIRDIIATNYMLDSLGTYDITDRYVLTTFQTVSGEEK